MPIVKEFDRPTKSLNQRLRNSAARFYNAVVRLSSTHNRRAIRAHGAPRYRIVGPRSISRCPSDLLSLPNHRWTHPSDFYYLSFRARPFFRVEVTARCSDTAAIGKKRTRKRLQRCSEKYDPRLVYHPPAYGLDVG